MSDLIKREDAIAAIECVTWYHQNRHKDMVSGANSAEHQAWYKAEDIYDALEAVPSAVDRRQGEWEEVEESKDSGGCAMFRECTCCGRRQLWMNAAVYNYCPNCGADMRGESND